MQLRKFIFHFQLFVSNTAVLNNKYVQTLLFILH